MVWSHPDISLEYLLKVIKGFVDILILASGYQSSGHAAVWDAQNIRKAIQWGLFFEDVFTRLRGVDDYEDSMKELDAALLVMTSNPNFPQGIANLSSATLGKAREFILRHLFHALPLRDAHLCALVTAAVEMDLNDLKEREYDYLNVYLDKLKLENTSISLVTETRDRMNSSRVSHHKDHSTFHMPAHGSVCNPCVAEDSVYPGSPLIVSSLELNKCHRADNSKVIIQELVKRQIAVSCISSIEIGLDLLSESLLHGRCFGSDCNLDNTLLVQFVTWNRWRSKNLSYLLDKRTIRLVSGANLIFSAPKVQWLQVFEQLQNSGQNHDDILHEIIENDIIEHLTRLLCGQVHHLWKISPILIAAAVPSRSNLFRLYLKEIEAQSKGSYSQIRCCNCIQDGKEHKECELAERIWCLHIIHLRGSLLMNRTNST